MKGDISIKPRDFGRLKSGVNAKCGSKPTARLFKSNHYFVLEWLSHSQVLN